MNIQLSLLTLKHEEFNHWEFWYDSGGGCVKVVSDCEMNYPQKSEHIMSNIQALRQFALMTTTEGWEVYANGERWHDYVDALEV